MNSYLLPQSYLTGIEIPLQNFLPPVLPKALNRTLLELKYEFGITSPNQCGIPQSYLTGIEIRNVSAYQSES